MRIRRTANAGVLLELDGQRILLDGVCQEVKPYLPTPAAEAELLRRDWPDVVAFTHAHRDHCDIDYANAYERQTLRPIVGPESLPVKTCSQLVSGPVTIRGIPTRHLGTAGQEPHMSFMIEGSRRVLFTGDATPNAWRGLADSLRVHTLICPYAYATGSAGWQVVKELAPQKVILVHFPLKENDPQGLWDAALKTVKQAPVGQVFIPQMGQTVTV